MDDALQRQFVPGQPLLPPSAARADIPVSLFSAIRERRHERDSHLFAPRRKHETSKTVSGSHLSSTLREAVPAQRGRATTDDVAARWPSALRLRFDFDGMRSGVGSSAPSPTRRAAN